jgi:hypothetical protein
MHDAVSIPVSISMARGVHALVDTRGGQGVNEQHIGKHRSGWYHKSEDCGGNSSCGYMGMCGARENYSPSWLEELLL